MSSGEETIGPRRADPPETIIDSRDDIDQVHDLSKTPAEIQVGAGAGSGAVASFQEFSGALIDIGLIESAELEVLIAAAGEEVLGLSRTLVNNGKLTSYQAAAIYQKKSRGLLIGDYIILDKLGQGGMGVVFKARHRRSGRLGALKILPPSFARDKTAVMRFRREVEAAGRVKHLNLVAAFDAAEDRGVNFLVMDYVDGRDLDRVVDQEGPLSVPQAVDYVIQAARGLAAAHAKGIVHRDIKPGNLIVDVDGTVRVLDLGLARIVDANNPFNKSTAGRLTQSGMYMGTVDYMAPEQAEDSHRVDHRADIYSLGCTLFYLLTGKEPFPGDTILKRVLAHQKRAIPSLRGERADVPLALDSAYRKMLAKRPQDRPASMTELIALLQASKLQPDEVVERSAPPPKSRPELMVFNETSLKRAGPPKPKAEPSIFARQEEREGLMINQERNLEDLVLDVRSELPQIRVSDAGSLRPPQARPLSRLAIARSLYRQRPPLVTVVSAVAGVAFVLFLAFLVIRGFTRPAADSPPEPPVEPVTLVATSVSKPAPIVLPKPQTKTIFDGKTGQGWMLCNRAPVPPANVQPDGLNPHGTGSYLVVYDQKLGDFVLDFDYKLTKGCNSGVFLRVSDLDNPVQTGIEVSLDDTRRGDDQDSGGFWGLVAPATFEQKPRGDWNHMTITAKGSRLAVALNGADVVAIDLDLWSVAGKRPDGSSHRFKDRIIARTARTGYLGFQDLGGVCWFKNIVLQAGSSSTNPAPAPSTDGVRRRAAATPAIAKPEPYVVTMEMIGHQHPWVESVSVVPGRKSILTSCYDKTARLWDITTGREVRRLWHPAALRPVVALPDGRRAVTGCNDGFVRLWDLETGREVRRLVKHDGEVCALAISPDGTRVLSGGSDSKLRLLDVEKGREIRTFAGPSAPIWSVAFSPDGGRVIAGTHDGVLHFGDAMKSDRLDSLPGHTERIWAATFVGDGRHAVTGGDDGALIYWDLQAKSAVRRVRVDDGPIRAIAFDPDGGRVAFGGTEKNTVEPEKHGILGFWDYSSDRPPRLLDAGAAHLGLGLLPHGGIATADNGGIVRFWQPSRAIASARSLANSGKFKLALAEYDRAINARPDDAALLIERGRFLTEHGESSRADADFTRAAQLASDNPQLFLSAGWWVAGPYPPDINASTAIEQDAAPDPSKPPPPSGNEPRRWQYLPTRLQGEVDLRSAFDADNVAAYALTVIHVQSTKDVVFMVGTDDAGRIWLNGTRVLDSGRDTVADFFTIPVTLRPGRNTVLAKVVNGPGAFSLHLRISDARADHVLAFSHARKFAQATEYYTSLLTQEAESENPLLHMAGGRALAEEDRFKDAAAAYQKARALEPKNEQVRGDLLRCYVALGDVRSYQPLCKEEIERYAKDKNINARNNAIWLAALLPGALTSYSEVIDIARKLVDNKSAAATYFNTYGALLYRAKHYLAAINFLSRSIQAQNGKGDAFDWVFLAMARHQLKQSGDREALRQAAALAKASNLNWHSRVEINALLDEARTELGLETKP
jgi:serine/threonine protein kinase/WD40 repeat protein/Flp pilus assembly protein TadD